MKDDSGAFVKSRLDEPALKAIAAATGGLYAPLGAQGQGLETIYKEGLAPTAKHDLTSRRQKIYTQRYQWPLGGIARPAPRQSYGRHPAAGHCPAPRAGRRIAAGIARTGRSVRPRLAAGVCAGRHRARLDRERTRSVQEGRLRHRRREYAAAAKSDPKKPELQFNAGTAAYRAGQFPQAAQAFQQSISRATSGGAERLADQEDAYYNLGNTLYRTGQKTEQSSPEQTLQTWTEAVKAYDTALQLRAGDADSKYNRDFVKRKIDELKKKQNQNQNQSQDQNKNQTARAKVRVRGNARSNSRTQSKISLRKTSRRRMQIAAWSAAAAQPTATGAAIAPPIRSSRVSSRISRRKTSSHRMAAHRRPISSRRRSDQSKPGHGEPKPAAGSGPPAPKRRRSVRCPASSRSDEPRRGA